MKTVQEQESGSFYWPEVIEKSIVFFDGECVMCNGFVDLLLKVDPSSRMQVAPLQGETARQLLPPLPTDRAAWSIFYKDETHLYQESDAFIHICQRLGGLWSVFSLIWLVPRPIRDGIYRMVARNRYRAFGRRSTCRMPSEQEKNRFLP
jgi:predicted DCC family thiol-disulfide oxidoreductase YuxK